MLIKNGGSPVRRAKTNENPRWQGCESIEGTVEIIFYQLLRYVDDITKKRSSGKKTVIVVCPHGDSNPGFSLERATS